MLNLVAMKTRMFFLLALISTFLLGCQSLPPAESDIDNDVCVGDLVVVDSDQEVDLEEMAKQADCP